MPGDTTETAARLLQWSLLLGIVPLVAGAFVAVRRRLGAWRWLFAAPALAALPLATGWGMWRIASESEPYSICSKRYDWTSPRLPMASEGNFNPRGLPRFVVTNLWGGGLFVDDRPCTFAEMEQRLAERPELPVLLRVDRFTPYRHVVWILDAVRASGRGEILFAVSYHRFADRLDYWPTDVPAPRGYWPDREFAFPLLPDREGPTLLVVPRNEVPMLWGPGGGRMMGIPRQVEFHLGEDETQEWPHVVRWLHENPPARLEMHRKIPAMYLVAILNELRHAGLPLPALSPNEPGTEEPREGPSDEVRHAPYLPYPAAPR